jgi:hypothetical protein
VPACNEAATIEPALRSLLSLDYPSVEVIAVDDRSSDGTGAIIERLASQHSRLRLLRIGELPPGWLGKNHALHRGSQSACNEWLLFTDADVVFHPQTLRRVINWAARMGHDHVVALPKIEAHGFWEKLFVPYFMTIFNFRFRPWLTSDPTSPAYMGIGAFNLVRADRYHSFGGHAALRLEVTDDMKLGKLMKAHGARSGVVDGSGWVGVRWVIGLRGIIDGLTKNCFAGVDFRPGTATLSILALLAGQVCPAIALLAGGWPAILAGLTLAAMVWTAAANQPCARRRRVSGLWGLGFPLAALIFCFILARSTLLAYRRRGIVWRGTYYALEELRRGIV